MKKKRASPMQIALLAGATVLAVTFAVWNVQRALTPPSAASVSKPSSAAATGTNPGTSAEANQPAQRVASAAQEAEAAPQAGQAGTVTEAGEAFLAGTVDPFAPLQSVPLPPASRGAARAVAAAMGGGPGSLPNLGPPPMDAGSFAAIPTDFRPERGSGSLPPAASGGAGAVGSRSASSSAPRAEEPAPELIGTLLGDEPSGVFRVGSSVVTVPAGQRVGQWKVLSVTHGAAVVKNMNRVRRLEVASRPLSGSDAVSTTATLTTATPANGGRDEPAPPVAQAASAPRSDPPMAEVRVVAVPPPAQPPLPAQDPNEVVTATVVREVTLEEPGDSGESEPGTEPEPVRLEEEPEE